MTLDEFAIGDDFVTDAGRWRCTDKGSRIVCAIRLTDDPTSMNGPPYAVAEIVFDEHDQEACRRS